MKYVSLLLWVFVAIVAASCSGNSQHEGSTPITEENSEVVATSTLNNESENGENPQIVEFLQDLYKNYVFGADDFDAIKGNFSPAVLKKLRDGYDYDCEDDDCYAVWLFRSGANGGECDVEEITGIDHTPTGEYVVSYNDMGHVGKCTFTVNIVDDKVMIEDFK